MRGKTVFIYRVVLQIVAIVRLINGILSTLVTLPNEALDDVNVNNKTRTQTKIFFIIASPYVFTILANLCEG